MGPLGIPETIFIFVIALLMFGPKKLPELGKTIGKAMGEFKRASSELKETFEREMQTIERETAPIREDLQKQLDDVNTTAHDYNYYDSHGYGNDAYHDSYESYSSDGGSSTPDPAATSQIADTVSASATQGADNQVTTASIEGTVPANAKPEPQEHTPKGPQAVA